LSAALDVTPPEVREVGGGLAVVVRRLCAPSDFGRAQQEARRALDAALAGHQGLLGRRLTVWKPPVDGLFDYAPGVLVTQPIEVAGEVSLLPLPRGRAAHLQLRGSFAGLGEAWRRLFEACAAKGETLGGLNWEVYPPEGSPPEAAATDLYTLLAEPAALRNR
jgi:hypothetical protein